jgi:hypothetical protein
MTKLLLKSSWVILAVLAAGVALAQDGKFIERFTATGVRMQTGRSSTVVITIERWSTPEERQMLVDTLREKGRDALAETLFKMPRVGYIRLPDTAGKDLHYAWQTPLPDGGRRVVVGCERTLTFREGTSRAQQYEFAVVEMRFDKNGKGEGKLSAIAKVDVDKKTNEIEVENYDSQPVRLVKIKVEKP